MYTYAQYTTSSIVDCDFSNLKDCAVFIYPDDDFDYSSFEKTLNENADEVLMDNFAYLYQADISSEEMAHADNYLKFLAYPLNEQENIEKINQLLYSGISIDEAMLESGENVCIVCGNPHDYDIYIDEQAYTVVGEYDVSDNIAYGVIPYSSALKSNLKPYAVLVSLRQTDDINYLSVASTAVEKFSDIFPNFSVESAAMVKPIPMKKEFTAENKLLAVMIFLVFLMLCCLYSYIFRLRERKYVVFKICGALSNDIVSLCIGEMLMLFVPAFLFSAIIFYALKKLVFYKLIPAFAFVVDLNIYLCGFVFKTLLILIIFGSYAYFKSRLSPTKLFAESFVEK